MRKSNGPKRNVWKDPSPYGTYEGERGNPDQWRTFFNYTWNRTIAKEYIPVDETPFSILGVAPDASLEEIKKAFRKLMLIHHPDKGGDIDLCRKIIAAYVMLTEKD